VAPELSLLWDVCLATGAGDALTRPFLFELQAVVDNLRPLPAPGAAGEVADWEDLVDRVFSFVDHIAKGMLGEKWAQGSDCGRADLTVVCDSRSFILQRRPTMPSSGPASPRLCRGCRTSPRSLVATSLGMGTTWKRAGDHVHIALTVHLRSALGRGM